MPSVSTILKGLFALAPLVAAAPAKLDARQEASSAASSAASATSAASSATTAAAAPAAMATLSDVDILQL